jgi:hypothetical protein
VSDDSLNFLGVCCYRPFFIFNFINLGLFPPHFSQICQKFVNFAYFFQEPAFCFIDTFNGLLASISLILVIIFIIYFHPLGLGLACSCFSWSLRLALGCLFEISLSF